MGVLLPTPPQPLGRYLAAHRSGQTLYLSGHGPLRLDGTRVTGKVGRDLDLEQGCHAALLAGAALLSTMRDVLGSLDSVLSIDRMFGMVNVAPGFTELSTVIDAASNLLIDVFGDAGQHARSAVGMAELPGGIAVELELVCTLGQPE